MPATTVTEVLDREFLTIRSRLLDLAAAIDRLDRAEGEISADPRWRQIQQVIEILASPDGNRAERTQLAFSLAYSEDWRRDYGL
jgi:hypothetical protein